MKIEYINAIQILDSRGNPTVEVSLTLNDGSKGNFKVPSGASTGIHEALELRDNDKTKYHGKSVQKVIKNIKNIRKNIENQDFQTQKEFDEFLIKLDNTPNKSKLGANAILGLSIAFAKASAKNKNLKLTSYLNSIANNEQTQNYKLPQKTNLFSNIINGGLHAGNKLKIQEFMIIPNLDSTSENIRAISETYHTLKNLIAQKYSKSQTCVGDEGGFAPDFTKTNQALDILVEAIKESGYENKIGIALDCAASDFFLTEENLYEIEEGIKLNYEDLTQFYNNLIKKYPIISIEDPFAEDDFKAFEYLKKNVQKTKIQNFITNSNQLLIVGDDLLVTNPQRIKTALEQDLCNSLLLKINQIGSLTESINAYNLAKENNWEIIVSHRSGETCDNFIADLCVALNSSIKIGAPARGERTSKYNRLLKIYQ